MAQTPISKQVPINNAAKDDLLGNDGIFHFTFDELVARVLANDPGSAGKSGGFFFGDSATGTHTQADQIAYLTSDAVGLNYDATTKVFTMDANTHDFNYFVEMGNKGTWSEAHVTVTDPVAHAGAALFTENFDGYGTSVQQTYQDGGVDVFATVDLNKASGWQSTGSNVGQSELGANGYGNIHDTSPGDGGFWFDTMNSPGQVNISHAFTDSTEAQAGKTSVLSFDAAYQDLNYQGNHYETAANASFEFRVDGVKVAELHASDFVGNHDNMVHFDIDIGSYAAAGSSHTLQMVDTTAQAGYTGFAIDSIQIHDWIV